MTPDRVVPPPPLRVWHLRAHIKDSHHGSLPFDSPAISNLCVKGRFGVDFVHSKDRLTEPLVRTGGALSPAAWDAAMSLVAERLLATRDQYGPDSIGFLVSAKCTNEENYLMQKVARGLIGTNNIDHCARL
jgi:formate dehydrogenase alpha subunit